MEVMATGSLKKQPASAVGLYASDTFLSSSSLKPLDWQRSSEDRSVLLPWLRASLASCTSQSRLRTKAVWRIGAICVNSRIIFLYFSFPTVAVQFNSAWDHSIIQAGRDPGRLRAGSAPGQTRLLRAVSGWGLKPPRMEPVQPPGLPAPLPDFPHGEFFFVASSLHLVSIYACCLLFSCHTHW